MTRAETTKFLSELLIADKFRGAGKHWASEVSIDPFTTKSKRVDFMLFYPVDQMSVSGIEKGIFTCYEIKSCKEDVYSGSGLNFLGEKNYIVTTMDCYRNIMADLRDGTFVKYLKEHYPESSVYFGVMVAIPSHKKLEEEFENVTPLDAATEWKLATPIACTTGPRKRPMTELLFCMLRSGR